MSRSASTTTNERSEDNGEAGREGCRLGDKDDGAIERDLIEVHLLLLARCKEADLERDR